MDQDPTQKPSPFDDPFLRREAGEGWHPQGLNKRLLGALVAREALGDELNVRENTFEQTKHEFDEQVAFVEKLKEELGIGEPPQSEH